MLRKKTAQVASLVASLAIAACGQDPAFMNLSEDGAGSPGDSGSTAGYDDNYGGGDALAGSGQGGGVGENGGLAAGGMGGAVPNIDTNGDGLIDAGDLIPGAPGKPPITFPNGTSDSDASALRNCLAAWKNVPFSGVTGVNKIYASVSVGGFGGGINDTARTETPILNLIYAGVNVNSNVTYNFMNPSGYYCIKANVNVGADLDINLHCNARLADSALAVNVGSNVSDATAQFGVHVGSNVTVNTVRPVGDRCVR